MKLLQPLPDLRYKAGLGSGTNNMAELMELKLQFLLFGKSSVFSSIVLESHLW